MFEDILRPKKVKRITEEVVPEDESKKATRASIGSFGGLAASNGSIGKPGNIPTPPQKRDPIAIDEDEDDLELELDDLDLELDEDDDCGCEGDDVCDCDGGCGDDCSCDGGCTNKAIPDDGDIWSTNS